MIERGPLNHSRALEGVLAAAHTRRRGVTLSELLVVVTIMAILFGVAVLRIGEAANRAAVRSAVADAATCFSVARQTALSRRSVVALHIDTMRGWLQVRADSTVVLARDMRALYGVTVTATRDSMAYDARGLGIGAANLSLVARRGRASDTLFVSRFGRTRH